MAGTDQEQQIRRDAHYARIVELDALLAELEQCEARLAKVPALVEALERMLAAFGGFDDDPPTVREANAALAAYEQEQA